MPLPDATSNMIPTPTPLNPSVPDRRVPDLHVLQEAPRLERGRGGLPRRPSPCLRSGEESPLWEAVETCERLFRATRIRTSTENVGLARHTEGLELVRIGEPLRPEFAAWRYGDQFCRRRRRWIAAGSAGVAANLGTYATINLATGGLIGGAGAAALSGAGAGLALATVQRLLNRQANVAEFRRSDGTRYELAREHVTQFARIRADDDEPSFRVEIHKGPLSRKGPHSFEGDDARRAINALLPLVNGAGAAARHMASGGKLRPNASESTPSPSPWGESSNEERSRVPLRADGWRPNSGVNRT